MSVREQLAEVQARLPQGVRLVAVSKTHPAAAVREAYDAGQRDFGENKVQELVDKHSQLPSDIRWHMIGHLQRNKVKYIAPFVHMIHSADSVALLDEIQRQALRCNRVIPTLIEAHVAREETKSGMLPDHVAAFFAAGEHLRYTNIEFRGLMCMATYTDDRAQLAAEFQSLAALSREILRAAPQGSLPDFVELCMGMSADYDIAAQNGSTMVRVGSAIFGQRDYR